MRLIDVWPFEPAAAMTCSRRSGVDRGVHPIRHRHDGERQPDTGTDRSADGRRSEAPEVVVAGHVTVDGQSYQGEDPDQADSIVDGVGQLAGEVAERPVGCVGRPAEQRERGDEADVGDGEVSDVVVGDGLGAQLRVTDDDVQDQSVAGDADQEGQEVRHEDDDVTSGRMTSRLMTSRG